MADEATYVKSFLVLNALGGNCLEDFDRLREDAGLADHREKAGSIEALHAVLKNELAA